MRKLFMVVLLPIIMLSACSTKESMPELIDRVFKVAQIQYSEMDTRLAPDSLPRSFTKDGQFVSSNVYWWCSGFYPGSLWYIYEYTQDEHIKNLAHKNTIKLEPIQFVKRDHDVGFQLNCSYGNGYRLTGNESYKPVLYQGAQSLATRFNEKTGVIKSWDFVRKGRDWKYPVIIDNMMNLELLMSMGIMFDNDSLQHIACMHANTTLKNHFRNDYTTYHLVDYDPEDGSVRSKQTVQGYNDDSSWARGQAWALYSFTMMFRFTGFEHYLLQAQNVAQMLLRRLPKDGVPYWDFDVTPNKDTPKDASSAAIMASAFLELSKYEAKNELKSEYIKMAERQLRTLSSDEYLAKPGENGNFLLKHSVGSFPDNSEVDVPLTYADYYFLEALLKYKNLELKH